MPARPHLMNQNRVQLASAFIIAGLVATVPCAGQSTSTPSGSTDSAIAPDSTPPRTSGPFIRSLRISSLNNYFSVVGEFSGRMIVFDDLIVVKFDRLLATRLLPNDNQRIRLDSIRVGVGVGDTERWSPVDDSEALQVEEVLPKGGRIVRRDVRFDIHHARRDLDASSWIVVTFHITVGRPGETGTHEATTYAHSVKGVLVPPALGR